MSDQVPTYQPNQILAGSKRVFRREDEDASYPTYTNNVEFGALGIDVFMDIGVVSPEALREAVATKEKSNSQSPPIVDFTVIRRFGMTIQTAIMLHQRLSELLRLTHEQNAAALGVNPMPPPPNPAESPAKRKK